MVTLVEKLAADNEARRINESKLLRTVEHWRKLAIGSFVCSGVMMAILVLLGTLLRYHTIGS